MNEVMAITRLLDRAEWYEAFALLFTQPVDETTARLKSIVSDHAGKAPIKTIPAELHQRFRDELDALDPVSFRREYNRLFVNAGACRSNETDYERLSFNMTQQLADVSGFYAAFGIQVDQSSGERPDYVGTELEFVRLLLLKQAFAEENDWTERAEVSEKAVGEFVRSHLVTWIPEFCANLLKATEGKGPYAAGASLLEVFIAGEGEMAKLEEPG